MVYNLRSIPKSHSNNIKESKPKTGVTFFTISSDIVPMSETLKHVTLLAWLVNRSFLIWELGVSNLGVGISDLGVRIWLGYFEMGLL